MNPDLDTIIQSRNFELRTRNRRKIADGLEKIRSQNSKNQDGIHPLKIFPSELWVKILSYLVHPIDLESTRASCQTFHELLEDRHLRDILFPRVLQLEKFQKGIGDSDDDNPVFPFHPFPRSLLKLRPVCKSWRRAIDRFFSKNLDQYRLSHDPRFQNLLWTTSHPKLNFYNPIYQTDDVGRMISSLTRNTGFNTRAICMRLQLNKFDPSWRPYDNVEVLLETFDHSFQNLLEIIGGSVRHFYFNLDDLFPCVVANMTITICDIYRMLHGWINKMSNLKYLELFIPHEQLGSEMFVNLLEQIRVNPFSRLEKLKRLTIFCTGELTASESDETSELVLESILRSNQHVKDLSVAGHFPHSRFSHLVCNLNLEAFAAESNSHPEPWPKMRNLLNPNWPLRRLKLSFRNKCPDFENGIDLNVVPMHEVIRLLEDFETLEDVHLEMVENAMGGSNRLLSLPRLKHFILYYYSEQSYESMLKFNNPYYYQSLDYLVGSGNLRKITWLHACVAVALGMGRNVVSGDEVISFQSVKLNMWKSNVWEIFPFLEEVEVIDRMEDYEEELATTKVYQRSSKSEMLCDAAFLKMIR